MDIYPSTGDYLLRLPYVEEWPEITEIIHLAIQKKPRDWQLPVMAGLAVGGSADQMIPVCAAVACAQIAIILIDDMLDSDPRGYYHKQGMANTANLAAAFQALALEAVARCDARPEAKSAVIQSLDHMMLVTAIGQYLDMQNPGDEPAYWKLVRLKSSPFFGAALEAGAWMGGASGETAAVIEQLGHIYGELIQIHDDFNDSMAVPANPDWTQGRSPLPILFAQTVDHPDRERFTLLRKNADDQQALLEAQSILMRSGAISYTVDQIFQRHQKAQKILSAMQLVRKDNLESLFEDVINPVKNLFQELSVDS